MAESTTIRIWYATRELIEREVHTQFTMSWRRTIDVLTHGWSLLTAEQAAEARLVKRDADEFASQSVWGPTYERIEAIRLATALDRTQILHAMAQGWSLLEPDQRAEAVRLSMTTSPEGGAASETEVTS